MNSARLSVLAVAILVWFAQTPVQAQLDDPASGNPSDVRIQPRTGARALDHRTESSPSGNQPAANFIPLAAGTTIRVSLEKPVEARKNKPGDEVIAIAAENVKSGVQIVIPKGSKIVGHVTEARAKTNAKDESESVVGIAFDRAVLKDGRAVALAVLIQALAGPEPASAAGMQDARRMADANRDAVVAVPVQGAPSQFTGKDEITGAATGATAPPLGSLGDKTGANGSTGGVSSGRPASGSLNSGSHGVIGINGLALQSEIADPTQGSLIVSQNRNVRLDSGTQMMLRVKEK